MDELKDIAEASAHTPDRTNDTGDIDLQLLDSVEEELDEVERKLAALDGER